MISSNTESLTALTAVDSFLRGFDLIGQTIARNLKHNFVLFFARNLANKVMILFLFAKKEFFFINLEDNRAQDEFHKMFVPLVNSKADRFATKTKPSIYSWLGKSL